MRGCGLQVDINLQDLWRVHNCLVIFIIMLEKVGGLILGIFHISLIYITKDRGTSLGVKKWDGGAWVHDLISGSGT